MKRPGSHRVRISPVSFLVSGFRNEEKKKFGTFPCPRDLRGGAFKNGTICLMFFLKKPGVQNSASLLMCIWAILEGAVGDE